MEAVAAQTPLTNLLDAWRGGDGRAFQAVIDATYVQLRGIAEERLQRAHAGITLAPQDVLHEALARLLPAPPPLKNRAHFFATLSLMMRGIIVDHSRSRAAVKHGGAEVRVTLTESLDDEDTDVVDVLAMDQALRRLADVDARCSDVLHLTYFAGLRQDEIAGLLQVSVKTIERDLRFSRAWLHEALGGG